MLPKPDQEPETWARANTVSEYQVYKACAKGAGEKESLHGGGREGGYQYQVWKSLLVWRALEGRATPHRTSAYVGLARRGLHPWYFS